MPFFRPNLSLSVLNLGPFFLSCILLQIGSALIHPVKKWISRSAESRTNLSRATLGLTLLITIASAYGIASNLENSGLIQEHGIKFRLLMVITMTATTVFFLLVAHLIQRFGMGNGIALVSVVLILPEIVGSFRGLSGIFSVSKGNTVLFFTIYTGIFLIAYHLARRVKKMPLVVGDTHEVKINLPCRPTLVGRLPVEAANFILLVPMTLAVLLASEEIGNWAVRIQSGWPRFILFAFFVFVGTYLYALLVFKPRDLQHLLAQFGYKSPETGKLPTDELMDRVMSRTLVFTILFLVIMGNMKMIMNYFSLEANIVIWPLVILGGVTADLMSQISFFYDRQDSHIGEWKICDRSGTEFEAVLKAGYLNSKGIPALIEPLRFSWGMPTGTLVDEYRIHVPAEYLEKAGDWLKIGKISQLSYFTPQI